MPAAKDFGASSIKNDDDERHFLSHVEYKAQILIYQITDLTS